MGDYINDPHFDGISKDEYDMLMDILSKIYSEIGEFTISCAGIEWNILHNQSMQAFKKSAYF